jgi:hypothetical protein
MSMELRFACPICGQHLSAISAHIGITAQCPNCNAAVTVPIQSTLPPKVPTFSPQPQQPPQDPQGGVIKRTKFWTPKKLAAMTIIGVVAIIAMVLVNIGFPRGPQRNFTDLQQRDWYEDIKRQQVLKEDADFRLSWIASRQNEKRDYPPELIQKLDKERQAHKSNYEALSSIASKILGAKEYSEYQRLRAQENEVLKLIEADKIRDKTDVLQLRLTVGEIAAERLEIEQRYQ